MKTIALLALAAAALAGCATDGSLLAETPQQFATRYCAAQTAISTAKAANQILLATGKLTAAQIAELDTAGSITMMGLDADRQARGITAPIVCQMP